MENPFKNGLGSFADKIVSSPVGRFMDRLANKSDEELADDDERRERESEMRQITADDLVSVEGHTLDDITKRFAKVFPANQFTSENLLEKLNKAGITKGEFLDIVYASSVAMRGSVQKKTIDRISDDIKAKIASIVE